MTWTLSGTLLVTLALLHSQEVTSYEAQNCSSDFYGDCTLIHEKYPNAESGAYMILPCGTDGEPFQVYCDMDTDGGGWTVFQRREDGSLNFTRNWSEYKLGFGNVNGEHWLGNDKIYRLSSSGHYEFRVDMSTWNKGEQTHAPYNYFRIGDEKSQYKLIVGNYTGAPKSPGDSFVKHRNMKFSTIDNDNDKKPTSCAKEYLGGWWYEQCHLSNLNGCYFEGKIAERKKWATGVSWYTWKKHTYSLKTTEMKIRRKDY
ncbi:ficolin-2-like [Anneissia japonica]|uniref:ficolin-2-like n=1 Tax=Anneissia japonica TaxID=1529436 RepID=UPI0014255842|nr:ficolin-2-like [Anneissia japonica]